MSRAEQPPAAAAPAGQFLQDEPPEPRADVERVVDERRECHQGERDADPFRDAHHVEKFADAVGVNLVRLAGELRRVS